MITKTIMPALLTPSFDTLHAQFCRLAPWFRQVHIDIQDGRQVPSTTQTVLDIVQGITALPPAQQALWKQTTVDLHLMEQDITHSLHTLPHLASLTSVRAIITDVHHLPPLGYAVGSLHPQLIPALNPDAYSAEQIQSPHTGLFSYPAIQVMAINPGPQGQPFIPTSLDLVNKIKQAGYLGKVSIDGAMDAHTVQRITQLPAALQPDTLLVGSYFARAPAADLPERIRLIFHLFLHARSIPFADRE